jgi:hypothetical protein
MSDRPGEVEVEQAGLNPRDPLLGVHLEDLIHLGGDDHDRVVERGRATCQAGAAPPRHERSTVSPSDADRGGDLVGRAGPADRERTSGGHTGVTRVQRQLQGFGARAIRAECRSQIVDQGVMRSVRVRDGAEPTE